MTRRGGDKIGVAQRWHQGDHFDIALSKRELAIAQGAIPITWRQCGLMVANRKATGSLGNPATALDVFRARIAARHAIEAVGDRALLVSDIQLRIISLGAGVQSTTLALMAAHGEIGPMPDCAIFADTQSEPAAVYRHLDWLEKQLPFPIHRVTAGSLRDEILGAMAGRNRMDARPPFFTGGGGMLRRQCTHDFKLIPIQRKVRELLGLRPRQRGPKGAAVEQWIGISADEAVRMKPSRLAYVQHRWPLIENGMHRYHCLEWCDQHGYRRPPKSACTFCPYTDDTRWRERKLFDHDSFADACTIDEAVRPGMPGPKRPRNEQWFVHRSGQPLAEVDFANPEDRGQLNMFDNECEGRAEYDRARPHPALARQAHLSASRMTAR